MRREADYTFLPWSSRRRYSERPPLPNKAARHYLGTLRTDKDFLGLGKEQRILERPEGSGQVGDSVTD